jgi:CBS domain-containing protein
VDLASIRPAAIVDRAATLREAAAILRESRADRVAVIERGPGGPRLVRIVSDDDVGFALRASGAREAAGALDALPGVPFVTVPASASLEGAMAALQGSGADCVVLTGDRRDLVGILDARALGRAWAASLQARFTDASDLVSREAAARGLRPVGPLGREPAVAARSPAQVEAGRRAVNAARPDIPNSPAIVALARAREELTAG